MENYRGVIIEESLENKEVLKKVQILETEISVVAEKHRTPWIKQWTLHTVLIPENEAESIAKELVLMKMTPKNCVLNAGCFLIQSVA